MDLNFERSPTEQPVPSIPEDHELALTEPVPARARIAQSSTGACDQCRLRKVRCLASENSHRCQRCVRAGRECVYTTHSKTRRRKRTDTRVKELENKVAEMSLLLRQGRSSSTPSSGEGIPNGLDFEATGTKKTGSKPSLTGGSGSSAVPQRALPIEGRLHHDVQQQQQQQQQDSESAVEAWDDGSKATECSMWPDVVGRGILNIDKASELFNRYITELVPLYPAVVFPQACTMDELRKNRPILFLAVLAASAGTSDPALNLILNQEIQQVYANRIIIKGHKDLELVQSLLVSITWTYPPDKFEELKFHQQIHSAATMALDIGLGKKPRSSSTVHRSTKIEDGWGDFVEQDSRHVMSPAKKFPDSGTLESRRTLLACYAYCASASMSLRLPNMLCFTSWMADCVDVLETSADAAPTDKTFLAWVKLQRTMEESGNGLGLNEGSTVSLVDERVQLMLRSSERQLEAWRKNVTTDKGIMNNLLEIAYHVNNVYLHEIALHPDHDAEDFRPPFYISVKPMTQTILTPPYISAILTCISASDSLITTFLGMDVEMIRSSPTFNYPRVVYAIVVLMKLSISASAPSSELSKFLDPEACKVNPHLERLLVKLKAVALLDNKKKQILASKFVMILTKLRMWFQQQMTQNRAGHEQEDDLEPCRNSEPEKGGSDKTSASIDRRLPSDAQVTVDSATESVQSGPPRTYEPLQWSISSPSSGNFFTDFAKGPTGAAFDSAPVQAMQAPSWPSQPPPTEYPEPTYSFPSSSNEPSDFPMDFDPNLFTHLVDAELHQNNGFQFMSNEDDGMDYANMPDYNWSSSSANWPLQ